MQRTNYPGTTSISDHKLGATLGYLGYPIAALHSTVHETTRKKHVQFFFEQQSIRFTALPPLNTLLKQWRQKQIKDPHHLMNVCERAHKNYDAINRWQKEGGRQRLHADDSLRCYSYQAGSPPLANGPLKFIDHLQLAAALGEIGFQIHEILGQGREHSYGLAPIGLPIVDSLGKHMRYTLQEVTRLSPTEEDPRRLALEVSEPMHPLVVAFNLLRSRAELKKQIDYMPANLLIEDGARQALINMNPTGITMDHVTAHFKAPPLP